LGPCPSRSLCTRTLSPTQHLTLNWTNLKELRIFGCLVDVKFWEPFTTACTTAEYLVIVDVATDGRALQANIAKHVPLLEWIQFGICKQSDEEFEHKDYNSDDDDGFSNDGNVARYIASDTRGWKVCRAFVQMAFGPQSNDASVKRCTVG